MFRTTENFYGVLLPESDGWIRCRADLEAAFIEARETNSKV